MLMLWSAGYLNLVEIRLPKTCSALYLQPNLVTSSIKGILAISNLTVHYSRNNFCSVTRVRYRAKNNWELNLSKVSQRLPQVRYPTMEKWLLSLLSLTRRDNEWKRKNACLAIILSSSSVAIAIFLFAILYIMTSWASLPLSSSMCQFKCWTSRVWKYRYVLLVPRQVIRKNYLQKKKLLVHACQGEHILKVLSLDQWRRDLYCHLI